jgi:hypothetical protein
MAVLEAIDDLWVPRPVAAKICGLSTTQFDVKVVPLLESDAIRPDGRRKVYSILALVKVLTAKLQPAKKLGGEEADLWSDYDSPNLERLRAAKADQAEMDVEERMGRLIRVEQWQERQRGLFSAIKRFGETLQHQFGREAVLIFNEFVEDLKTFDVESRENATPTRTSAG